MFIRDVAFVVPCYNETLPLSDELASLLKHGEVVFVNDGSDKFIDLPLSIIKRLFALLAGVLVIFGAIKSVFNWLARSENDEYEVWSDDEREDA